MANPYKIIVWGTGMVGQYALRYLLPRSELKLVGVKCHSQSKEGVDAADLANGQPAKTGIKATRDRNAIMALDADVVIFVPFDPLTDPSVEGSPSSVWVKDLLDLLRSEEFAACCLSASQLGCSRISLWTLLVHLRWHQ